MDQDQQNVGNNYYNVTQTQHIQHQAQIQGQSFRPAGEYQRSYLPPPTNSVSQNSFTQNYNSTPQLSYNQQSSQFSRPSYNPQYYSEQFFPSKNANRPPQSDYFSNSATQLAHSTNQSYQPITYEYSTNPPYRPPQQNLPYYSNNKPQYNDSRSGSPYLNHAPLPPQQPLMLPRPHHPHSGSMRPGSNSRPYHEYRPINHRPGQPLLRQEGPRPGYSMHQQRPPQQMLPPPSNSARIYRPPNGRGDILMADNKAPLSNSPRQRHETVRPNTFRRQSTSSVSSGGSAPVHKDRVIFCPKHGQQIRPHPIYIGYRAFTDGKIASDLVAGIENHMEKIRAEGDFSMNAFVDFTCFSGSQDDKFLGSITEGLRKARFIVLLISEASIEYMVDRLAKRTENDSFLHEIEQSLGKQKLSKIIPVLIDSIGSDGKRIRFPTDKFRDVSFYTKKIEPYKSNLNLVSRLHCAVAAVLGFPSVYFDNNVKKCVNDILRLVDPRFLHSKVTIMSSQVALYVPLTSVAAHIPEFRSKFVNEINRYLSQPNSPIVILAGDEQSGKSTLAAMFALNCSKSKGVRGDTFQKYSYIFWISCETIGSALSSLLEITILLELSIDATLQSLFMNIGEWFSTNSNYLVIIDGANEVPLLEVIFQNVMKFNGHVIFTVRDESSLISGSFLTKYKTLTHIFKIPELSTSEIHSFLKNAAQSYSFFTNDDDVTLMEIAGYCDGSSSVSDFLIRFLLSSKIRSSEFFSGWKAYQIKRSNDIKSRDIILEFVFKSIMFNIENDNSKISPNVAKLSISILEYLAIASTSYSVNEDNLLKYVNGTGLVALSVLNSALGVLLEYSLIRKVEVAEKCKYAIQPFLQSIIIKRLEHNNELILPIVNHLVADTSVLKNDLNCDKSSSPDVFVACVESFCIFTESCKAVISCIKYPVKNSINGIKEVIGILVQMAVRLRISGYLLESLECLNIILLYNNEDRDNLKLIAKVKDLIGCIWCEYSGYYSVLENQTPTQLLDIYDSGIAAIQESLDMHENIASDEGYETSIEIARQYLNLSFLHSLVLQAKRSSSSTGKRHIGIFEAAHKSRQYAEAAALSFERVYGNNCNFVAIGAWLMAGCLCMEDKDEISAWLAIRAGLDALDIICGSSADFDSVSEENEENFEFSDVFSNDINEFSDIFMAMSSLNLATDIIQGTCNEKASFLIEELNDEKHSLHFSQELITRFRVRAMAALIEVGKGKRGYITRTFTSRRIMPVKSLNWENNSISIRTISSGAYESTARSPVNPPSAFTLYRRDKQKFLSTVKTNEHLSKVVSDMWRSESPEIRAKYIQLSANGKKSNPSSELPKLEVNVLENVEKNVNDLENPSSGDSKDDMEHPLMSDASANSELIERRKRSLSETPSIIEILPRNPFHIYRHEKMRQFEKDGFPISRPDGSVIQISSVSSYIDQLWQNEPVQVLDEYSKKAAVELEEYVQKYPYNKIKEELPDAKRVKSNIEGESPGPIKSEGDSEIIDSPCLVTISSSIEA